MLHERTDPKMSIELVQELLRQKQLERFMTVYRKIHDEQGRRQYANTLLGCLEVANGFSKRRTPYVIIGGLAVMAHLAQLSPETVETWRGTNDIDLLADKSDAEAVLRSADYRFGQSMGRKPGSVGPIFNYTKDDNGETTIVGLREGIELATRDITNKLYSNSTVVGLYSVPLRVPSIKELVALKRDAARTKDNQDIKDLRKHFKF